VAFEVGTSVAAFGDMQAIALVALGLLGALLSSVWLRRAELEFSGESPTMLAGLGLCLACVLMILFAAG
jgi:hypothetical protein